MGPLSRRNVNEMNFSYGSIAVLLTQLWPPQYRVRNTPDSRHDRDRLEHLRSVQSTEWAEATHQ